MIIPAVYLILRDSDNRICMIRRCNTGYMDGFYSLPAGHVEKDETVLEVMIHEVKEEVDITITTDNLKLIHVNSRTDTDPNRINFLFECSRWQGEVFNQEPDKCDDIKWFSPDNLPENIVPEFAKSLPDINQNNFYSQIKN